MTTNTNEFTARELREQAAEVRQLEQNLVDRLNNLPHRIAEANQAAKSRYAAMYADLMSGRSTEEPYFDYSEADAIAQSEDAIRAEAKSLALDRFELEARAYALDEQEQQKVVDGLREPLADLEERKREIDEEIQKLRQAHYAADSRRQEATIQRLSFERAAARERQSDSAARRMT